MDAIVAVFSDWGIGSEGTQQIVLKADRTHFRELTAGAAVIVGRRTLADFPGGRPLKGRSNIVVTRQNTEIEGAELAHSAQEAAEAAGKYERCFVIGGASIYRACFEYIDRVFITKIDAAPASDSYFPDLDAAEEWVCTDEGGWLEENGIRYCFCTYERRSRA